MDRYYRVPDVLRDDIRTLGHYVEQFKAGRFSEAKFRGFRVPMGVYEQREPGSYMMRIRIPGGGVGPEQLRVVAGLCAKLGARPHLTTRQDLQIQDVKIDDIVPTYQELYRAGLTCKGGGGNTVRNITACAEAGICADEILDTLPCVVALTEYMIQFPSSFNLPRKFKIAFSGCGKDCALATVNDLGFLAKEKGGQVGFSVYAAGGMGAHPRVAEQIESFITVDEVGYVAEAVKRLFDAHGERKNKHRARLRFVMEKLGAAEFKRLYREELDRVKAEGPIFLDGRDLAGKHPDTPDPADLPRNGD
ncbi:MAG: sulfite reductase, beta subunit (hemoprotein), partial [Terriglobia bacterium]